MERKQASAVKHVYSLGRMTNTIVLAWQRFAGAKFWNIRCCMPLYSWSHILNTISFEFTYHFNYIKGCLKTKQDNNTMHKGLSYYRCNQIESNRIESNRIESNRIESNRIESNRIESNRIESNRIESNRIESNRIESNRIESNRIESNRIESNRIESNRIESNQIEFYVATILHSTEAHKKKRIATWWSHGTCCRYYLNT